MFRLERFFLHGILRAALPGAIGLLALGCASPGPPLPPSLHLPKPVENLRAERVAGEVRLTWTTPTTTTDGDKIKGPMTAVVCLDTTDLSQLPAPAAKSSKKMGKRPSTTLAVTVPCDAVAQMAAAPGRGSAVVAVPATGPARVVGIRIDLRNALGKSGGASPTVLVAAGAAPAEVGQFKVSARREGILAAWQAGTPDAVVELRRTLTATAAGPVVKAAATKAPTPFSPGASKAEATELVLRPDGTGDAGGMVDRSAVDGSSYTYVAQRVRTVTLGGHALELRSAASAPVSITYRDVFPPKAPTGLQLIPAGGFGDAPSIDLSWDANAESDVLGYNVYRAEGGEFVKVNGEPLPAPAYRDLRVEPGHTYSYRVTAVDQRRNESAPGGVLRETLRK